MQAWEYFLVADNEADLCDREGTEKCFRHLSRVNRDWLASPYLQLIATRVTLLSDILFARWTERVKAFRSLVPRLKGRQTRAPKLDPKEADRILLEYVATLRPVAVTARSKSDDSLCATNFRGVGLDADFHQMINTAWARDRLAQLWDIADPEQRAAEGVLTAVVEWKLTHVFGSLASAELAPICGTCGKPLPRTTKGNQARREQCKSCYNREHKQATPVEVRREKARLQKRAERARKAAGGSDGQGAEAGTGRRAA